MKLEEAASILGVSLDDITLDGLKQTYKKLALTWDPEKCVDQSSKSKYQQISEAYKKLNSVMEGKDPYRGDDSHEVAAFMRMFMDMVGISESDSIPAAMTFGMMFGSNQNIVEEWSTDDDGDGEYDDDDDDEDDDCDDEDDDCEDDEEYLPDEYFDEYAAVGSAAFPVHLPMPAHPNPYANSSVDARVAAQTKMLGGEVAWEPQVKQYSNMNLKDQLNMQRQQIQHGDLADDDSDPGGGEAGDNNNGEELTEAEKERKQKLAKKRAEKRRKQKEKEKKKARDASPEDGAEGEGDEYRRAGKYNLDFSDLSAEELAGVIQKFTDQIVDELMQSVTNGQLGKVNQILSFDFVEEMPALVATQTVARLKDLLPSTPVLHQCVTNLNRAPAAPGAAGTSMAATAAASGPGASVGAGAGGNAEAYNTAMVTALAARRLEVAKYLVAFNRPAFELGTTNSSGLSVLHYAVLNGDLKIAQLVIRTFSSQQASEERKGQGQLNINSRCHRQGWAPLHYAVERLDLEAVRLLVQHGANLQATVATDKRQTPLELARQKLKAANAAGKAAVQAIIDELQSAIEKSKASKEAESKSKKQTDSSDTTKATTASAVPGSKEKKSPESAGAAATTPAAAADAAAAPTLTASENPEAASKADKKKKKKDKEKEKTAPATVAPPTAVTATPSTAPPAAPRAAKGATASTALASVPPAHPAPTPASAATAKAGGKTGPSAPTPEAAPAASAVPAPGPGPKNKKGKSAKAAATAAQTAAAPESSIDPIAEMSVSSRDELVDRLLAMGFREADCLQAIALYGTDTDRAISWLCEKPVVATPSAPATAASAPVMAESDAGRSIEAANATAASAGSGAQSSAAVNATPPSAATAPPPAAAGLNSAQKLQREKDELRRINQAWNQKAIEEKRKAEALKKQADIEKQQAEQLAKQQQEMQRQQLVQQEFIYQQHLQQQQQYMALQQQQMQFFAQQQAAMFGTASAGTGADGSAASYAAMGNAAGNANFSMGSLQHMTNMLAAPARVNVGSAGSAGSAGSVGPMPTSSPSLQTLSGAMAMAMSSDAQHYKPAYSSSSSSAAGGHTQQQQQQQQQAMPSLSDAMSLSFNAVSHPGGATPRQPLLAASSLPVGSNLGGSAGAFGLGLNGSSNSLGLFGNPSSDPLAGLSGYSSSDLSGNRDLFHSQEALVDGALELSAVAKPFVPRFGPATATASISSASSVSPASSSLSGPSLSAFGVSSALGSGLGGLGLGVSGLGGSTWGGSSGLSMDAKQDNQMSSFLSTFLPSELNLDEDNFEYGDTSAIIPDLDSFLLNDN